VSDAISEKQFVGVDLHLHRSVICRIDGRGQQLECVQIDNDPKVSRAGFDGDHQATEDQGWQHCGSTPRSFGSERSG
jgi:hypothetical protein